MEILKAIFAITSILSMLCLVVLTFAAYANRKDSTWPHKQSQRIKNSIMSNVKVGAARFCAVPLD